MAKKRYSIDPWLSVCNFCPLPDCVRSEGEIQTRRVYFKKKRIQACPIYIADKRGWDACQAIENRDILGLLKD